MKSIYKLGFGAAMLGLSLASCTKGFEDINQNPQVSPTTSPELLLSLPGKSIVDRDFDWFYDCYQYQMQWMQFGAPQPGSTIGRLFNPSNTNDFYQAFYKNIAPNLVDIDTVIARMPEATRPNFAEVGAIARIMKVYSAWRVSDANGSIPYTKAFGARYGGTFTPTYDTQEQLFDIWDAELKQSITAITSKLPNQQAASSFDIFYSGRAGNWAAAANVLRMKIAMRLMKRNATKATTIIQEVMASPAGLFTGNGDEWKFVSGANAFGQAGNWEMTGSVSLVATKNVLDFMQNNSDPRLGLFFEKNSYTKEAFDSLKAGGVFPQTATYSGVRYVGAPASPDKRNDVNYANYFTVRNYEMKFNVNGQETIVKRRMDTVSNLQRRLFATGAEGIASPGQYTQPILTYAEQCFMIAELAVRGIITGQDAATWYTNGIKASISAYDNMGRIANILDYAELDQNAVNAYVNNPNIQLTGDQATDLEKIQIQLFLNYFKSPWEAWGSWKRTGVPKVGSSIMAYEPMVSNGSTVTIPRRWALPQPTVVEQTQNWRDAVTEMQKTGEYGNDVNQYTGRVWWDMQ
ncbi:SusD/RagB family nutrient-binding outer membrane lipoprotein [Chitinophaga sp. sic0106]|uniref:SusD/RagB family nutrient-binding outer membrane lipoprotein n=1 Tax=Chitinophaga sp. sic0106 TaxID=2854785 RepID=UPI001C43E871|nr:SusD/RagB family nutrient-binding outer membrane lipoprotein [Chitinophaga sp. sic0106]MBV7531915.1 SusD/RagB family nutrient-binding outer membrane lipoprotein [Chitinophaga sp. sic0106]